MVAATLTGPLLVSVWITSRQKSQRIGQKGVSRRSPWIAIMEIAFSSIRPSYWPTTSIHGLIRWWVLRNQRWCAWRTARVNLYIRRGWSGCLLWFGDLTLTSYVKMVKIFAQGWPSLSWVRSFSFYYHLLEVFTVRNQPFKTKSHSILLKESF